ncbi:efflux RND transporter periplasmic adaptor subunit [Anaeromyxobacter sp. PSR-1]|uniref:efflux RND transporter periplasmic adaptor subunit n=1 Tax=Anaeromyxobacter sp. PSR-1 TaxID=1300915 RepID=UPI0005E4677E|nr:HlyD family efflux transporter periplasmic adaptor subunit [Anaeromyxobacter sp. PSR-1]GAO04236.1 putative efflux system component YknX [Anaeromyxobacter sp. PSR-1]
MRRWIVLGAVVALALAGAAAIVGRGAAEVEVRRAARGPIAEWVEGTGKARVRERHAVSAPVTGALERVEVHAGDAVRAGAVVARVLPLTPTPLDPRSRSEARARVAAARAAEAQAEAALRRARVVEADAARTLERARALLAASAMAPSDHDAAEATARAAREEVDAARATVGRVRAERVAAEAVLAAPRGAAGGAVPVASPVAGVVLRVVQESPGPVLAGTPVLEVGDPRELEVALELLTEQASRVRPGAEVELTAWGGDAPLAGRVRRVEPSAFTKVSALGVEEQRVNVLVDPAGAAGAWSALGDGWRVEGRVAVARRADALRVPASSVFRGDGGWAVYAVEGGRARLRPVQLGALAATEVEIAGGLADGTPVVLRPTGALHDGARVRAREP